MYKQILSCDWGTSRFRLRLVNVNDYAIIDEMVNDKGIAAVYSEWLTTNQSETERTGFYRDLLQSYINQYFNYVEASVPVIISGMASSTIGMKELDYKELPFDISNQQLNTFIIKADDKCEHDILLISGLKTADDVMRGEETKLLGCTLNYDDVLVIFPGTHSKHVFVKNNVAVDFKTYMTGEFFNLLSAKSILSKSVITNNEVHTDVFIKGVKDGTANNLLNSAFHVRTNQLFKKFTAEENYHYLSGLIIGCELKDVSSVSKNIYVVSSNNLSENYLTALKVLNQNLSVQYKNADEVLIKAHCKLSANLS